MLYVDFETASEYDIRGGGAYNYAQHPSTRVLCMAYAFGDEDVQLWTPDMPFPDRVRDYTGPIYAHNAAFERLIFWYVLCPDYGLPEPALERFYCTATQARANCLPGSLEDAGRAISSRMRKDHRGPELVRKCCCPPFNTELLPELYDYCIQDVRTMREISKTLRPLSDQELSDYHINERINDRGLGVDVPLCRAAIRYAEQETTDLQKEVIELTQGEVVTVRSPRLREWVLAHVGDQGRELMKTYTDDRVRWSIDKSVRTNLLALSEENPDEVPQVVAEVVRCTDALWASSVAKFGRLATLADEEDSRIRGAFIFAGASATGRNSSQGAQLQNMSRKCADDPVSTREAMLRGDCLTPTYGKRVTDVLRGMLRPAILAKKGNLLISLDWSGIEARLTPWMSGVASAEKTLDVFRNGGDIYISTAADMFHKPVADVTKADRMLGKVAVLACGFGGGAGAFASMGRIYGVQMAEEEAQRIVDMWRKANPWAVQLWSGLEYAALAAMRNPSKVIEAGKVSYFRHGDHLWYSLPSGRVLCYPFAKFDDEGRITYLKAAWKPKADAKEWPRAAIWRGTLIENAVQASANCLLREALRQMDSEGIQVIASIHDEIVVECKASEAEATKKRMEEIMTTNPSWATGLPLAVEGNIMERFSK